MSSIDFSQYSTYAVVMITVTASILLISQDWRWSIGGLLIQYIGIFILVHVSWTLPMALVKLIAGWISSLVLGMAILGVKSRRNEDPAYTRESGDSLSLPIATNLSGFLFHLLAAVLIVLAVISNLPRITNHFPEINTNQMMSSLFLIGLGLLQLGFTNQPMKVITGLLTFLAGFEVIYSAVENSTLVAGLLSGVTLSIATLGAFLIVNPTIEVNE